MPFGAAAGAALLMVCAEIPYPALYIIFCEYWIEASVVAVANGVIGLSLAIDAPALKCTVCDVPTRLPLVVVVHRPFVIDISPKAYWHWYSISSANGVGSDNEQEYMTWNGE